MARLHTLTQHSCERGNLTVFEKILPGSLNRIFYITQADERTRGGHQHQTAWQALICIQGSVDVCVKAGKEIGYHALNKPTQCLVLEPNDWHLLENFRDTAIVLVVSNEQYNEKEYIHEWYAGSGEEIAPRR